MCKIYEEVEAVFRGQGQLQREATLKRWRYLAGREAPNIDNERALWEHDQWDPDAKAWRETGKTIEWETNQVAKSARAIEEWRRQHPVQSLALRTGLKRPPADLFLAMWTLGLVWTVLTLPFARRDSAGIVPPASAAQAPQPASSQNPNSPVVTETITRTSADMIDFDLVKANGEGADLVIEIRA